MYHISHSPIHSLILNTGANLQPPGTMWGLVFCPRALQHMGGQRGRWTCDLPVNRSTPTPQPPHKTSMKTNCCHNKWQISFRPSDGLQQMFPAVLVLFIQLPADTEIMLMLFKAIITLLSHLASTFLAKRAVLSAWRIALNLIILWAETSVSAPEIPSTAWTGIKPGISVQVCKEYAWRPENSFLVILRNQDVWSFHLLWFVKSPLSSETTSSAKSRINHTHPTTYNCHTTLVTQWVSVLTFYVFSEVVRHRHAS